MDRHRPLTPLLALALPLVVVAGYLIPNAPYLHDAWRIATQTNGYAAFSKWIAFHGALQGCADADHDIKSGKLTLRLPAAPSVWTTVYAAEMQKHFRVKCIAYPLQSITAQAAAAAYDEAIMNYLRNRYGNAAIAQFDNDVRTDYHGASGLR